MSENAMMRAAVYDAPGQIATRRIARPVPGPDDVLLRVRSVGICGSDLHVYRAGAYDAQPGWVMGHEFCGAVAEVGERVKGIDVDARYTGFSVEFCGECYWCKRGRQRMCPSLFHHYTGYGELGGMAEYVMIRKAALGTNLFEIPASLSDDAGALAEPLGTAAYAVRRAKLNEGDIVVVLGAGLIGNLLIQTIKARVDATVIVTEVSEERREAALRAGADVVLDALRPDLAEAVYAATGEGRYLFGPSGMADVVFNAAAAPPTYAQSLDFVRALGTVVLVGLSEHPASVDLSMVAYKDIRMVGVVGSSIPDGIDLLATGQVTVDDLVGEHFSIDMAAKAFEVAAQGNSTKVVIRP